MRTAFELTLGFTVAAGLFVATVVLWVHSLIIFAAPVGFLAVGSVWVAVDNTLIYPRRRAAQASEIREEQSTGGELHLHP